MKENYIMDNKGLTYEDYEEMFEDIIANPDREVLETINIDGAEVNKLNKKETIHLLAYTGHSAKWINSSINNNQFDTDINKVNFVKTLDQALNKIPSSNGSLLYRMDDVFSIEEAKSLIVGEAITIKSYFATSKEDWGNTEIVWLITPLVNNSLARDISNITGFASEKEVLFSRGASFKFKGKQEKNETLFLSFDEI